MTFPRYEPRFIYVYNVKTHNKKEHTGALLCVAASRTEAGFFGADGVQRDQAFTLLAVFWQSVKGRGSRAVTRRHGRHLDNRHHYKSCRHPSPK